MSDRVDPPHADIERTILLIDDDRDSRAIYGRMLRHVGYRVVEAATAYAGLRAADIEHPHAAVVDIELPDLDGCALIHQLRASPATERIAIVALTAHVMPHDREAAIAAGCDVYVSKPAAPRAVAATVDALLGVPRPSARLAMGARTDEIPPPRL
jgi:two-component system, cell cycle response regulator DivK